MIQRAGWVDRRTARSVASVAAVLAALCLAGCVGAIERDEFQAVVAERGGGLSNDLVSDAIALVSERVGTAALELTELTANPGSRIVLMTIRDPGDRDHLDRYVVAGRDGIRDVTPVRVSASDDLDELAFAIDQVPVLTDLELVGDGALAALAFDGGYVETIGVRIVGGEVRVSVTVGSPRANGYATFDGTGTLTEARRS